MKEEIYRFRTIEQELDRYHELEKQTIYFASPEELNDPMEDSREMVWSHERDDVWNYVFRDFIRWFNNLERLGPDGSTPGHSINLYQDPELQSLEIFRLEDQIIQQLTKTSRNIKRHKIKFMFHYVYMRLLATLEISIGTGPEFSWQQYLGAMEALEIKGQNSAINEIVLSHAREISGFVLNQKRDLYEQGHSEEVVESFYYPEKFLDRCEKYIYPKYYVACFSNEYSDATMWAHYGNGHTGVCLIFGTLTSGKERYLDNADTKLHGKYHLRRVNYHSEIKLINVLESVEKLENYRSLFSLPFGTRNWSKDYLETFRELVTTKTCGWEREHEFRLIWEFLQEDRGQTKGGIPQSKRLVKYDFDMLKGVIFGIKTTDRNKIEIMKVIDRKCSKNQRNGFKYYQAYLENGRVEKFAIKL